jgi:hypothetical protein
MPFKRQRRKHRRQGWGVEHEVALRTGSRYFGAFNGPWGEWPLVEAQEAWAELGAGIMARWDKPCLRPWGWWRFELGIERPDGKSAQRRYLFEADLLSPAEVEVIEADRSLLVPPTPRYLDL